ncbi:PaaI family thioesterase [Granulosicoccus antarcticus]|uniref:Thioesterase domain-containing protein n=1 Tax=Granulosicoccus antarcticus IMCC3135 TaxID=1192854 RepID=A0A2Z2P0U4_9GAMM|nr:PaaI family thioesterase [Granulosicoccus antarcticus]ASJ73144.1 hypothetical protein IMCC3135_15300 [Granulosicoccus antarcticus IMCC3135]
MNDDATTSAIIEGETGAQRLIGYTLDVGQPDARARCYLTLSDAHLNRHHVLHGGIATTMLDNAMGATASLTVDASGRIPFMTISLNTHFLAPAAHGTQLIATGRIVGGGKSLKFIEGELVDSTGRLIATASGVFKRVPATRLEANKPA